MNTTLNLFEKGISIYGILSTLGLILSLLVVYAFARKDKFEFFDFTLVVVITLISAFIGSKLTFILVSFDTIIQIFKLYSVMQALNIIGTGGFVFYGGLIGGFVGLIITTKIRKESVFKYTNLFALALPLGHAVGRVGCFFAGCCYGVEYNGIFSHTYKNALDASTPIGKPLLAIQLIEAFVLVILFIALLIIYLKTNKRHNLVTWIYIISYAIIRFVLEFLRGDVERGALLNLSTSQWISLAILLFVGVYFIVTSIIKSKLNKNS